MKLGRQSGGARGLRLKSLAILAWALVALLGPRPALAVPPGTLGSPAGHRFPEAAMSPPASSSAPGKIRLTTERGEPGPITLLPRKTGYAADFTVWNDGAGPLTVSRVTIRTDLDDPRVPPHVNARFTDGSAGATVIQAHASKRVTVTWAPEREAKMRQAIGHVVLTSTDEVAGEVAMGFVASAGGPLSLLTSHGLTWLILLPLIGAIVAGIMGIVGYDEPARLRALALGLSGLQCVYAGALYLSFNGAVTRWDGDDGFQFVERAVVSRSLGVEYFVGVDGTSISLVLLTAIVGFVAAVASYGVRAPGLRAYYGFSSLLLAGAMGVFLSLDLSLFATCWVTMLVALVLLVARGGVSAPDTRAAGSPAVRLAVYSGLSVACLVFAVGALHSESNTSFLIDGTKVARSFALPELMRVAFNAKHLAIFGVSWVKVVWGALFVAFGVVAAVVPVPRWFLGVLGDASGPTATPVGLTVVAVVLNTGIYGLLRVSLAVLPDGSRWAAGTLVAFGVVNIAVGAVMALRQTDLRRLIAYATVAHVGFCLVGLGAMTREGLAGCLLQMSSHGVITGMLVLMIGSVRDRVGTSNITALAGLAKVMPFSATLAGVALLASAGVPGLSGFWGETLPVLGAFPAERLLAVCAAGAGLILAAAHLRAARGLSSGSPDPSWSKAGAPLVELGPREVAAVTPLLVLCVALGLCPGSFFTLVQGGVSDLNQLVNPPGPDEIA